MSNQTEIDKKVNSAVWMKSWAEGVLKKGEEQVKKELGDYWNLMSVHSKLLDRVTLGRMSKTNYTWEAISEVLDDIRDEPEITVSTENIKEKKQ